MSKLVRSGSLLYCDLRWNEIGNEGAGMILNALQKNNNIQELNLIGNKISNDLMSEINEKIKRNKSVAHNTYLPKERDDISKSSKKLATFENFDKSNQDNYEKEHQFYSQVN